MKNIISIIIMAIMPIIIIAQDTDLQVTIVDRDIKEPIVGANLLMREINKGDISDMTGRIIIKNVESSQYSITVSYIGYETIDTTINASKDNDTFTFYLTRSAEEVEEVTIKATRSTRTIKNIPTRVEFIGGEELEEKAIMNPANISLVLRESTGIQIQQTSLSSGNSSIRIQGLDGRYTQLLKDGLPLYSGFSGGLSILQIPPLDLAQFEIIKGSSSTLYGGGAIAGLVNMVSKQPGEEAELDVLLAQTHTGGSTANAFYSDRGESFGYSLYGSAHHNAPYNPDDDSFTNIPRTTTVSFNPKLYYYPNEQSIFWFGINATTDTREGGNIDAVKGEPNTERLYTETNSTNRISSQLVYEQQFGDTRVIEIKNSIGYYNREISLPDYVFEGDEVNSFTELNYSVRSAISEWIAGANIYTSSFRENREFQPRDLDQTTYGLFLNNTTDLSERIILETGFRTDYSINWGTFALPRVSILWNVSDRFSTRLGGGLGYKIPDLFTEEAATLNYQSILPIDPDNISAERSYGLNLDLNYRTAISEELVVSLNQLFYVTQITDALLLSATPNNEFEFINAPENLQSIGLETNVKFSYNDFRWFINYAYIDTKLKYLPGDPQKPLTPRHHAGTVLMFENEEWRIGYEAYYTGSQVLSTGVNTTDFITMGLLVQKHFEWGSPYINFENFTDRRQNRFSPEVSGTIENPTFQEIYAPTDGFVFTIGILLKPFGREYEH